MKKEELKALGLADDVIKQIQIMHGRDMAQLHQKLFPNTKRETTPIRGAIESLVAVLKDTASLYDVLSAATRAYYVEAIRKKANKKARAAETEQSEQTSEDESSI